MKDSCIETICVVKKQYNACKYVCTLTVIGLYVIAALGFMTGFIRPLFIQDLSVWTVWYSMVLEAAGYGCVRAGNWIRKAAL